MPFFRLFPGRNQKFIQMNWTSSWPPNKPINNLNVTCIKLGQARLKLHEIAVCFPNTMLRMDKQIKSVSADFLPDPPGRGSFEALAMGLASNFRNNQALQLKFLMTGSLNFSVQCISCLRASWCPPFCSFRIWQSFTSKAKCFVPRRIFSLRRKHCVVPEQSRFWKENCSLFYIFTALPPKKEIHTL